MVAGRQRRLAAVMVAARVASVRLRQGLLLAAHRLGRIERIVSGLLLLLLVIVALMLLLLLL